MKPDSHELRKRIEYRAERDNHGVVLRSEARAAGMTRAQIDRRVRSGQWVSGPSKSTVLLAAKAANPLSILAAATQGHEAVAWGASALALWEIGEYPTKPVIASERRPESDQVEARFVKQLGALPLTNRQGIRTASVELGLASSAQALNLRGLNEVIDETLRRRLTTWERLERTFDEFSRPGRPGSALLRKVKTDRAIDAAVPLSQWSRDFANKLMAAGLPRPWMEWRVNSEEGILIAQVDLAYPKHRYALELDSVAHHLNTEAFEVDRYRDAALSCLGWRVGRFTWRQFVYDWDRVVDTIEHQLGLSSGFR